VPNAGNAWFLPVNSLRTLSITILFFACSKHAHHHNLTIPVRYFISVKCKLEFAYYVT